MIALQRNNSIHLMFPLLFPKDIQIKQILIRWNKIQDFQEYLDQLLQGRFKHLMIYTVASLKRKLKDYY